MNVWIQVLAKLQWQQKTVDLSTKMLNELFGNAYASLETSYGIIPTKQGVLRIPVQCYGERRTKGKHYHEDQSESGEGIGAPEPAGRLEDVVKIAISHDHFVSSSDGRHCAAAGIPDRSGHLPPSHLSSRRLGCLEHGQTNRA